MCSIRAEALNLTNTVLLLKSDQPKHQHARDRLELITSQTNFPRLFQMSVRITF